MGALSTVFGSSGLSAAPCTSSSAAPAVSSSAAEQPASTMYILVRMPILPMFPVLSQ